MLISRAIIHKVKTKVTSSNFIHYKFVSCGKREACHTHQVNDLYYSASEILYTRNVWCGVVIKVDRITICEDLN